MIEVYEGRLGGGKSYSAVVRIVDHLRQGGLVCTNIEICWVEIVRYVAIRWGVQLEEDQFIKLTDDEIGQFHKHTPSGTTDLPVLVVVDEAHLNFNCRDWAKTDRELLSFLTQSRKVATDVIFISQSALNMDKQFMRLVQYIWRFRDLTKFKIPGLGIGWPLNQLLACQYDYDGVTLLQREFVMKDRRIFALYNTHSLLRAFPRLEGVKTKRDLKTVERNEKPMMKLLLAVVVIIGIGSAVLFARRAQASTSSAPVVDAERRVVDRVKEGHEKATAAYEIYDEQFRGWNGPEKSLHTSEGWYTVGEMSHRGFVMAVSSRRARVETPEGRSAWVIANDSPLPPKFDDGGAASRLAAATPAPANLGVPAAPAAVQPAVESIEPARTPTPAVQARVNRGVPLSAWPRQVGRTTY